MHASEWLQFVSYLNVGRMALLAITIGFYALVVNQKNGNEEFINQSQYIEIDSYGDIVSTVQYVAISRTHANEKVQSKPHSTFYFNGINLEE